MKRSMLKSRNGLKVLLICLCLVFVLGVICNNAIGALGAADNKYFTDFASKDQVMEAADKLNEQIAEEGFVLLKNNDNVLPLKNAKKISVFGRNSVDPVYGGSGSGSGNAAGGATIYSSLRDAGYDVNPKLEEFYGIPALNAPVRAASPRSGAVSGMVTGETPLANYPRAVKDTYSKYDDAAFVVFSRVGGEGSDVARMSRDVFPGTKDKNGNPVTPKPIYGAKDMDDHYLELDKNESELLAEVTSKFDKVIVIINSSSSMELGFLEDEKIDGAIWVGGPGKSGFNALGRIVNGTVNPSGKTVDIYSRDFTKDPTWNNFGNHGVLDGNALINSDKSATANKFATWEVSYEEGIYLGYRYYETRAFTEANKADPNTEWYKENVVFPFGYGLSYTTFDWTLKSSLPAANAQLAKDGSISVSIEVQNTGKVAGKEVVQLYYTAPYIPGGLEKAHVVMGDFTKTKLLQPGEKQTVTLKLKVQDMSSYDASGNGAYVLDAGKYEIKLMKNSHEVVDSVDFTIANKFTYTTDSNTGKEVKNRFGEEFETGLTDGEMLSRSNWETTWPQAPTEAERTFDNAFFVELDNAASGTYITENPSYDDGKPWFTETAPTQAAKELTAEQATIKLKDMIGLDYKGAKWDLFLNQFTAKQLAYVVGNGSFGTKAIDALGVPDTSNPDGPAGLKGGAFYASECVIAATFSKDLARQMGEMIGNEALWSGHNGWYAPAVNTHRSPFSGRNFEYYSEDPILSGYMSAYVIQGARSKGIITYVKHFGVNDQETNRNGVCTWLDEQTAREIYLKPFELSIEIGESLGVMAAFNRIGSEQVCSSYSLMTEMLRDEWGFEGVLITDMHTATIPSDRMIRAGTDLSLGTKQPTSTDKALTPTHIAAMRRATKNVMFSVANSSGMENNIGSYTANTLTMGAVGNKYTGSLKVGKNFGTDWVTYGLKEGSKLPEGLTIDAFKGELTGTPTQSGTFKFTVVAYGDSWVAREANYSVTIDQAVYNGKKDYKVKVNTAITLSAQVQSVLGNEIDATYVTKEAGGFGGAGWDGKVPAWLTVDEDTGAITGTPTAEGTYEFTVRVKPIGYGTLDINYKVVVDQVGSSLTFAGKTLDGATIGSDYSKSVAVASGSSAVTYALKAGSNLPAGLTLNADGTITGKPTAAGSVTFTLIASAAGFDSAEANFTIVVNSTDNAVEDKSGCGAIAIGGGSNMMIGGMAILTLAVLLTVVIKKGKKSENI